jgi:hypothetical protein
MLTPKPVPGILRSSVIQEVDGTKAPVLTKAGLSSLILQQTSPQYVGLSLSGNVMQDSSSFPIAPEILAKLREQLRSRLSTQSTVLGSTLVPLINNILGPAGYQSLFPDGEKPQLRKVVECFLSDFIIPTEQRQGSDFVYEIIPPSPTQERPAAGQLWKSFVAVKPSYKIAFDHATASIRIIKRDVTLTPTSSHWEPLCLILLP